MIQQQQLESKKGSRQGYQLLLALFNFNIKKAINNIKFWLIQKEIGVKIGGTFILMLHLTVDIIVFTTSEENLQAALNIINTTFKKYSLKVYGA